MRRMIRIVALLMAALMAVTTRQAPDSDSRMADGTVDVSFTGRENGFHCHVTNCRRAHHTSGYIYIYIVQKPFTQIENFYAQ